MKKFLFVLGVLFAPLSFAQTFPVQNLQVNGTANIVGNAALGGNLSVTGTTTFASPPTVATSSTIYPTVPSNAALKALSTVGIPAVTRLGFNSVRDVEPVVYTALASPCALNSGAGDNGSQVQSSNGQCWIGNMPQPNNVQEWGAVPNGVVDDTAAIQNTINYAQSLSRPGTVYIPAGQYIITSNLNITGGIQVIGEGYNSTWIMPSVGVTAFAINTVSAVTLEKMFIDYASPQSAGLYGVTITSPSGVTANSSTILRDLQIAGAYNGVQFTKSAFFIIDHCLIENFTGVGVQVSNALDIDVGDSIITNSTIFNFSASGGSGVQFLSSGGLRVENNKFGALAVGVDFLYATNAGSTAPNTAQLLITGNSFDTMSTVAVRAARSTNTDSFNSIIVANNVMPDCGGGLSIPLDASGVWLNNVNFTGNIWRGAGTGTPVGVAVQSTNNVSINNNNLIAQVAGTTGITIGSSVTGGLVQLNNLAATPVTFATTIFNGGTNVTVANNAF